MLSTKDINRIRSVCPFYMRTITLTLFLTLPTNYCKSKVENKQTKNKKKRSTPSSEQSLNVRNTFYSSRYVWFFLPNNIAVTEPVKQVCPLVKITVKDLAHFVFSVELTFLFSPLGNERSDPS